MIERCDPPKSFAATWEYGGEVSWIELRLTPEEGGTRFQLEHIAHVDDTKWAEFGPGAVGVGWDLMVRALSLHLGSSGAAVDRKKAMAWMGSEEGRRFMTSSSEAWYAANVAGGEDEKTAREAADRTAAAYTGAGEGGGPGEGGTS